MTRISNFIYSGDLIQLTCCQKSMPTYYGNDLYNVLMAPLKKEDLSQNKLSKLRLIKVNVNPANLTLIPIRYGDDLFIEFNITDEPESSKWNHEKRINIGKVKNNDIFKLISTVNKSSIDPVHIGDEILIASSINGNTKNIYLSVEKDFTIKTDSSIDDATKFILNTNVGCGPNWRYDQDTRGLNGQSFSESDINELSIEGSNILLAKLQTHKEELNKIEKDCQDKLNKENVINQSLKNQLTK